MESVQHNDSKHRASYQVDILENTSIVRFALDSHDCRVDWPIFYPTILPDVSESKDHQVRLWRVNGKGGALCIVWSMDISIAVLHPSQKHSMDVTAQIIWLSVHTMASVDCIRLETMTSEIDTCRGYADTSCPISHHRQELVIATAEDQCICIWDMSKYTTSQTLLLWHSCFWVLTAHPEIKLFTAGTPNYEQICIPAGINAWQ